MLETYMQVLRLVWQALCPLSHLSPKVPSHFPASHSHLQQELVWTGGSHLQEPFCQFQEILVFARRWEPVGDKDAV